MEWMLDNGHATAADLDHCEENGRLDGDPDEVPAEARNRGRNQVGSLGSGNHFLEVQRVAGVYDEATADAFGLARDRAIMKYRYTPGRGGSATRRVPNTSAGSRGHSRRWPTPVPTDS